MEIFIIIIFILGYSAIALEHPIKINKTASALLTGVLCWTLFVLSTPTESLLSSTHFTSFLYQLKIDAGNKFNVLTQHDIFIRFVGTELSHSRKNLRDSFFSDGSYDHC